MHAKVWLPLYFLLNSIQYRSSNLRLSANLSIPPHLSVPFCNPPSLSCNILSPHSSSGIWTELLCHFTIVLITRSFVNIFPNTVFITWTFMIDIQCFRVPSQKPPLLIFFVKIKKYLAKPSLYFHTTRTHNQSKPYHTNFKLVLSWSCKNIWLNLQT